jgi:hypothetical protein
MHTPTPSRRIPFALASRSLRFRVLVGDDSGYAVTRRIGLGGAIFRASIVPPIGTRIRLLERYGAPGADACIEADVVAVIPEPSLDGTEPGFVAEFRDIMVRGGEKNLVEFIHMLEPGYLTGVRGNDARQRGDVVSTRDDDARGTCGHFAPGARWAVAPLLHAAGIGQHAGQDLAWDDGLEEVDLTDELGASMTPVADPLTAPRPTAPPPQPTSPASAGDPPVPRRKRGITGIFGSLFGKSRDDDNSD